SRSRSSTSQVHGSPGGVKARPTEASARPYTGERTFFLKLYFENRSSNAVNVSGLTGSAPLKAKRHEVRSTPSSSLSWILFRHSSYEKFGPPEMVPPWRWMARSQELGRERNASGDISTTGKPRYMVAKQPPIRPMSW